MLSLNNLERILLSSFERAPWGWALAVAVILAIIKGWPALSDAAVRARSAMASDRRVKYDRLETRIDTLERELRLAVDSLHATEMKLVSALTAYRLVLGELQKLDPTNDVLKQAQALLNVSYPSPPIPSADPTRDMVRQTHAAAEQRRKGEQ